MVDDNKKPNDYRTPEQIVDSNKNRTPEQRSAMYKNRKKTRAAKRKKDMARRYQPIFDVHCCDDLPANAVEQCIENSTGHVYNAWLKQIVSKCSPLSPRDEDPKTILERCRVTAKQKVNAMLKWIGYMKDARYAETCAICGTFGPVVFDGYVEKEMKDMHFYKLHRESSGCFYYEWSDA